MDWETLYCPNRACRYYGIPWSQSALVKNGTSYGQKQALCRACGRSVYLRDTTLVSFVQPYPSRKLRDTT